jgi:hypothetical protein
VSDVPKVLGANNTRERSEHKQENIMKRVITVILGAVLALGLVPLVATPARAAAAGWTSVTNDPVWTNAYMYNASVDTWAELKEALNAVGSYEANKPYIILVNGDIVMSETYALPAKNIVLRKTISQVVYPDTHAGERYWDYSQPYQNTVVADPTLYDREVDWKITVSSNIRHFSVAVNGNIKLTLENITLDGEVEPDFTTAYDKGCFSMDGSSYTWTFSFAGNATRCHGYSTNWAKAGSGVFDGTNWKKTSTLEIRGGIYWKNSSTEYGGVIGTGWNSSFASINLRGYTRMQNNQALTFGGAIGTYQGDILVTDNVLLQNNLSRAGGAILTKGGVLTISGNARITGNTADYNTTTASGDFRAGSGGGVTVAWQSGDYGVVTLADNASIDNNKATRAGGGFSISDVSDAPDGTGIELHLLGGSITNNVATGETRTFAGTPSANELATIGSGGGIYMTHPKKIDLPADSTTSFSGNQAAFTAFIDNGDLQNLSSDMHAAVSFLDGDNYISHIKQSEIPTSVVNQHGPTGNDFFNLYNNYDVGVPNNIPVGLYSKVNVTTLPADGSGGNVTGDPANAYVDPLNTGVMQAEVGAKLKYTPSAEDGWYLKEFVPVSDPPLTADELASAWTNAGSLYTLTVPSVDVTLRATFHQKAVLSIPAVTFPTNYSAGGYTQPEAQPVTIKNTTPAGSYSDSATAVTGVLDGGDASLFTLTAPTALILPGATNATWRVRPNDSGFNTARTYATTLKVTYGNGAESVTLSVPVSMVIANAGDLYLPDSDSGGAYDFGSVVTSGGAYSPAVSAKPVTVTSVGGDIAATDTVVSLANQKQNDSVLGEYFTLANATLGTIASGASNATATVVPTAGLAPGDYTADLVVTYKVNGNTQTKTATSAVHFKAVTPAALTIGANLDFGAKDVGYAQNSLSYQAVALQNSGGTPAQVTKVELTGANAGSFRLAGADAGDGTATVGTVPANGANSASWSVIPKADLPAGVHQAQVKVTYRTGVGDATATATADVTFKVIGPPHIVTQPASAAVFDGTAVTLTVDARTDDDDTVGLTYQWYSNTVNSNTGGTPITLATAASYAAPSGSAADTGYYYVVISNSAGSIVSNAVKVTITPRTYIATVTPTSKQFVTAAYGYGAVAEQSFTFTNTGNQPLTNVQGEFTGANAAQGWFEVTGVANHDAVLGDTTTIGTLDAGAVFYLKIRPKTGLPVGSYSVSYTLSWEGPPAALNQQVLTLAFEVEPAVPVITWPTASDLTYGQTLAASTLANGSVSGGGTFAWQADTTVPTVANSGYTVVVTPADMLNYDFTGIALTHTTAVNVAKRQLTGAWGANAKTYDGTTAAQVSFNPDNLVAGDSGVSVSATGNFDTATVGWNKPVTVTNIAVNNPNYLAPAAPANLTADVTKAPLADPADLVLDVVENTATTLTVDLAAKLPSVPSPQLLGPVGYTIGGPTDPSGILDGAPQLVLGADAASDDKLVITAKAIAADDAATPADVLVTMHFANFADVNFMVTVEVTAKTPVAISGVSIADKTFDGTPNGYTGTLTAAPAAALGSLQVSYHGRTTTTYGPSPTPPTEAGDYVLTIAVPSDNLTYKGSQSWNFTIAKRTVDVIANDLNLNYRDLLPLLDAMDVSYDSFASPDTWASALQNMAVPSLPVTDTLTPGTWPIGFGSAAVLTSDAAKNYKLNHVPGTLTITALPPQAPGSFAATGGDGEVALTWTTPDNGGDPITRYELQIDDGEWAAVPGSDAGTVSHTVTGLHNGQSYTFKLRAVTDAGTGAPSSATATPKSNAATLRRLAAVGIDTPAENGTLANPEQATIQVPNTVLYLDATMLEVAPGATGVLYTDPSFASAGSIEFTNTTPTAYHAYVLVIAQNGRQAFYDVTITRALSSVAQLLQVAKVTPTYSNPTGSPATGSVSVENGIFEIKASDLLAADSGTAVLMDSSFTNTLDRVPLSITVDAATKTTLYVKVTSQAKNTSRSYVIDVTRQPLTDTTLFYVGGAAVSFDDPPAGQGTQASPTLGTVYVPHNVDTLSALAGGNIVPSDSASAAIVTSDWKTALTSQELAPAATTYVYVIVTAQDLSTKQYYKIAAEREGSNDTSLFLVAGTAPTFTDDTTGSLYVRWTTSYLTNASFEVAPGATATLQGAVGGQKQLPVGTTTVHVKVTAEDGTTAKTYAITVWRLNNTTRLISVLGYELNLAGAGGTGSNPITATVNLDWRIWHIQRSDVEADAASTSIARVPTSGHGDLDIGLPEGSTVVWINATAEDNNYSEYYKITFVRHVPTGTDITELYDTPVSVTSGDGSADTPYLIDFAVDANTDELVTADVRLSEGATTSVDADLAPGAYTTVPVTVTAAAGNTAAYRLRIWRHANTAGLSELVETVERMLAAGLGQAYTPASVLTVTDAIAAAKLVLADPDPTQPTVDAARQALYDALSKLEAPDDTGGSDGAAELSALVSTAQQLSQAAYTADSWAKLVAKRDAAVKLLANPAHTAAQVQAASSELLTAMLALQPHYAKEARVQVAKVNVAKGKAFHLAGLAYLTSGKTQHLTFTSSNSKIARVSPSGKVVGVKTGKVTITATSKTAGADGKKLTVKIQVKVVKAAHKVKRVSASFAKTLNVGAVTQLRPVVASRYATPGKVTFKSSNPKIAKIDKTGKLTALKKGTVKITITAGSKKKTYKVTVK